MLTDDWTTEDRLRAANNLADGYPANYSRKKHVIRTWRGVTYPSILQYRPFWWLWKRLFCPREWHLFDESMSSEDHCLYCDACGLSVHIARFEEE